jgi:hypothetical protein
MDQFNQPGTPPSPQDVDGTWTNLANGSYPVSELLRRMAEDGKDFLNAPARQTRRVIIPALQPIGAFVSDLARRNTGAANSAFNLLNKPAPGDNPLRDRTWDTPAAPGL